MDGDTLNNKTKYTTRKPTQKEQEDDKLVYKAMDRILDDFNKGSTTKEQMEKNCEMLRKRLH